MNKKIIISIMIIIVLITTAISINGAYTKWSPWWRIGNFPEEKTLYEGWNLIGWYQNYSTNASDIVDSIDGCVSVVMWDAQLQSYWFYLPGYPAFDFTVKQGMGLFVEVTETTVWSGE